MEWDSYVRDSGSFFVLIGLIYCYLGVRRKVVYGIPLFSPAHTDWLAGSGRGPTNTTPHRQLSVPNAFCRVSLMPGVLLRDDGESVRAVERGCR